MTQPTRQEIDARLPVFIAALQAAGDKHYAASYPNLVSDLFEVDTGGVKFARIVRTYRHRNADGVVTVTDQRSAHCFVDLTNGDILKADGWKKPAKGKRGSIFNDNGGVPAHADSGTSWLYR